MSINFTPSFQLVPAPVAVVSEWADWTEDEHSVPDWLSDIAIEWNEGFSNAPEFKLKVEQEVGHWPGMAYRKEGNYYISESGDGRRHELFHNGSVAVREVSPGVKKRATSQQDGFGGRDITLMMDDGEEIVLRGPWAGGAPAGWVAASYVHLNATWRGPGRREHWTRETPMAGVFFRNELIKAAVRKYLPDVRLAWVVRYAKTHARLEPLKSEWTAPKGWKVAA